MTGEVIIQPFKCAGFHHPDQVNKTYLLTKKCIHSTSSVADYRRAILIATEMVEPSFRDCIIGINQHLLGCIDAFLTSVYVVA